MINIYQIIIIGLFQILMINPLHKLLIQIYYKNINRPYSDTDNNESFKSLGMPSGHSETVVIIMMLLYFNNYINLNVALFMIFFICLQRLFTNTHSFYQVIIGCLTGFIMTFIYFKLMNSFLNCLIFIIIYIISLILILINKIDYEIKNTPTPEWVDKSLYDIIAYKKKSLKITKIFYLIIFYYLNNSALFCSWSNLEKKLDIIIDKIKDKKIDVIIGVKTGGAILAKYLSQKLNIPYDFIKISFDLNKCVKTPSEEIYFHVIKNVKSFDNYICEDIKLDISNKNILVIDELIATGKSMNYINYYLKNIKKTNNIINACISSHMNSNEIIKATDDVYIYWPWGYDN